MLAAISRPFFCLLTPSLQADQASGFHIRSVLCVPIWNRTHQIIGKWPGKQPIGSEPGINGGCVLFLKVSPKFWIAWTERRSTMQIRDCLRWDPQPELQFLLNKAGNPRYNKAQLLFPVFFWLQAFVIFCGLGINNTMMYNQVKKTWAKQSVALDVGLSNWIVSVGVTVGS